MMKYVGMSKCDVPMNASSESASTSTSSSFLLPSPVVETVKEAVNPNWSIIERLHYHSIGKNIQF